MCSCSGILQSLRIRMNSVLQFTRVARTVPSKLLSRTTTSAAASAVDYRDVRPFEEIPGPRGKYNIPFIGPMFHFKPFTDLTVDDTGKLFDKMLNRYGPLVRVNLGEWVVFVEDPADFEIVFRNEGKQPRRLAFLLNDLLHQKTGIPKSLADMQGEEWAKFRSILNTLMMRKKSAQHYLPAQNEVADDLVERLKRPFSPQELADVMYRYACESISVVCFDKRLGFLDPHGETKHEQVQTLNDISNILDTFSKSLRMNPLVLKYFPSKLKNAYFESSCRVFRESAEYYKNAVNRIKQQKQDGTLNVDKHNFMLSLMTSETMTPEEMSGVAFTLFVAGTDSTARTLQLVLYHLASNPEKQQNLFDEIVSIIGCSGPLTDTAVNSMTYLNACLKESYRVKYPTTQGTQRYLPTDIVLKGYRIPAGTSIMLMNQRTVKNPKYFPDPESFIPERWLRGEGGKREHEFPAFAMIPFGFGSRMCIGKRFAEQELCLAVTKILQKFQVSLGPGQEDIPLSYTPFAGPKTPIDFILKERNP